MEEQQHLIASRRAHRAHLTKVLKKITELKEVEDDQNEQHAIVTLGSYLEQLQRKGHVLSELDNKIFELFTKPEDLEADIIEAEDTQSFIAETICTTKNFIENKIKSMNISQHDQAAGASNNIQQTPESNQATSSESEPAGNQPSTPEETQPQSSTVSENLPVNLNQPPTTNPPTAAFAIGQSKNSTYKPRHVPSTTAKRACVYCKGLHSPNNCTVITDKKHRHNIVRDFKLCFNCLNDNHIVSQCKTRGRCKICHRKHHTSLCSAENPPPPNQDKQDPTPNVPNQSVNTINTAPTENMATPTSISPAATTPTTISPTTIQHLSENKHKSTLLKTAISPIEYIGSTVTAHILFDEGSHRSFITSSLARNVGLTAEREETLSLATFGGTTTSVRRVEVGTINLQTPVGENIPIEVIIVPTIAAPLQSFSTIDLHNLPHLKGLTFAHPITNEHTFDIDLLIGADHYWNVVEDEIIKGSGPTAAKSKIGYLLSGPIPLTNQTSALNTTILNIMTASKDDEFEFRRFWELESIGIQPREKDDTSDFLQQYQDTSISLKDGKYHAKLPWKPDQPILPPNAEIAAKRTRSMVRRMANDPEKLKMYNDVIINQEKQVAKRIREDIYVDDLVSGAQDDDEAVSFYTKARTLMTPGGFNLRSWASNNPVVKTIAAKENLLNDNLKPKVLGMQWDTINDTLLYPNRVTTSESNPPTKREVLRTSSKIYDPIGFLNPVVVNAKILMQEIWKRGLQWDELLPPEIQASWEKLTKELQASTHVQLPRQYFPSTNGVGNVVVGHFWPDEIAVISRIGESKFVELPDFKEGDNMAVNFYSEEGNLKSTIKLPEHREVDGMVFHQVIYKMT
ncbi:Hypothetical predicted protein [Paramuricea clavata]|uniref:DUF1758 domain-containing protein n=1 Tax=Paramuricea clavata TaxID=317549 RepID=A0A6S7H0A9_PARCT|nr:Hypothetical predicted protein [Paramuricea clavata]